MLQMYIKYQPVGDCRDTANWTVSLPRYFFDGERIYCQMLTSSTILTFTESEKHDSVGSFSGSVPGIRCYRGHTTARGLLRLP